MRNHYDRLYAHKISFLPMLCSMPSLKDVSLPQPELRSRPSPATFHLQESPASVRPRSAIKAVGSSIELLFNYVRYHKLKKLVSGKNLTPAASFSAAGDTRRQRVGCSGGLPEKGLGSEKYGRPYVVDLDMDPPLPVTKRVKNAPGMESLWKRRSGAAALRSLELQQIHHSRPHLDLHHHPETTSILIT